MKGVVAVGSSHTSRELWKCLDSMQSIDDVIDLKGTLSTQVTVTLDEIVERVGEIEVDELADAESYRVTCVRSGPHEFSSVDVEREVGAVLSSRYPCRVDLERPAVKVRIDVRESECQVGVQLNAAPLSLPEWRVYRPRVGLKTPLAYAMLRLAQIRDDDTGLLDPLCGSATIPIIAAQEHPQLRVCGSDTHARGLAGARTNARAAGLFDRLLLVRANAHELAKIYRPASFSAIVTNPPFGIHLSRKRDFRWLYSSLLRGFAEVIEVGGRATMLVWKYRSLQAALSEERSFELIHERRIVRGDTALRLVVLQA